MSKRRIVLSIGAVIVLAGCFYLVVSSLRHLPPDAVKPNAKPALAKPANIESSIAVNTKPAEEAQVIVADSQTVSSNSSSKPSGCNQATTAGSSNLASSANIAAVSQPLTAVSSNLSSKQSKSSPLAVDEQLQNSLLNIASSLSQQIYQPDN